MRYAARVAVERQPAKLWAERALKQTEPWAVIESGVALARMGGKESQARLLTLLNGLDFATLDEASNSPSFASYQITIARNGVPEGESLAQTVAQLDAVYPAKTNDLNRELSRTLVALGSSSVVPKTMQLMSTAKDDEVSWLSTERLARNNRYGPNFLRTGEARPNIQQIAYAYALRVAKTGWTPELRRKFFGWFASTGPWQGATSSAAFSIRSAPTPSTNVPDADERKALAALSTPETTDERAVIVRPPKGPGKNYTVDEVVAFAKEGLHGRDFKQGANVHRRVVHGLPSPGQRRWRSRPRSKSQRQPLHIARPAGEHHPAEQGCLQPIIPIGVIKSAWVANPWKPSPPRGVEHLAGHEGARRCDGEGGRGV